MQDGTSILTKLNSSPMYLICGGIIAFVALVCVVFMVRAYRAGKAIGMDTTKMKRVIVSSATFSLVPSVGILLGVIALSGSLGIPWPWLRLSVIGGGGAGRNEQAFSIGNDSAGFFDDCASYECMYYVGHGALIFLQQKVYQEA